MSSDDRSYPDDYCLAYQELRCLEPATENITIWGHYVGHTCKGHLPPVFAEIERLRAIVADLAELDCEVEIPVSTMTDETATVCITCDAVLEGCVYTRVGPTDHDPGCPWRRARESRG